MIRVKNLLLLRQSITPNEKVNNFLFLYAIFSCQQRFEPPDNALIPSLNNYLPHSVKYDD